MVQGRLPSVRLENFVVKFFTTYFDTYIAVTLTIFFNSKIVSTIAKCLFL